MLDQDPIFLPARGWYSSAVKIGTLPAGRVVVCVASRKGQPLAPLGTQRCPGFRAARNAATVEAPHSPLECGASSRLSCDRLTGLLTQPCHDRGGYFLVNASQRAPPMEPGGAFPFRRRLRPVWRGVREGAARGAGRTFLKNHRSLFGGGAFLTRGCPATRPTGRVVASPARQRAAAHFPSARCRAQKLHPWSRPPTAG